MRTITANTTVLASDDVINADCSAGNITISLPSSVTMTLYQQVAIVRVDRSGNSLLIAAASGETIENNAQISVGQTDPYNNAIFRLQALNGGWKRAGSRFPADAFASQAISNDLGSLAADPNTTGWGMSHAGLTWFNTTAQNKRMWNGSMIVNLG